MMKLENACSDEELAQIALNDKFYHIRMEAVKRISDESILADIIRNESDRGIRFAAVRKINDISILEEIGEFAPDAFEHRILWAMLNENGDQ